MQEERVSISKLAPSTTAMAVSATSGLRGHFWPQLKTQFASRTYVPVLLWSLYCWKSLFKGSKKGRKTKWTYISECSRSYLAADNNCKVFSFGPIFVLFHFCLWLPAGRKPSSHFSSSSSSSSSSPKFKSVTTSPAKFGGVGRETCPLPRQTLSTYPLLRALVYSCRYGLTDAMIGLLEHIELWTFLVMINQILRCRSFISL